MVDEQLSPVDLGILLAEHMGSLGIKWLQLMGMYLDLTEDDRRKLNKVYDRVKSQSKAQVYDFVEDSARTNPVLRDILGNIVSFDKTLGGGSVFSVHSTEMRDGSRWALSVERPGALFIAEEMEAFLEGVLDDMAARSPDDENIQLAKLLLRDALKWLALEIEDKDYERKNELFHMQNDYRSEYRNRFREPPAFRHRVATPAVRHTDDTKIRLEEEVDCLTLAQAELYEATDIGQKTVSREDAKEIASLCVQNFLYQVFETGLVHPDIHPGNVVLGAGNEVHLLDRKALLELTEEDRGFLKGLMLEAIGKRGHRSMVGKLVDRFASEMPEDQRKELAGKITSIVEGRLSSGDRTIEHYIAPALVELRKSGVEIPLDIELVFKSLLGANRIALWAGFGNLVEALTYNPAGAPDYTGLLKRVHPSISMSEVVKTGAALAAAGIRAKIQ